MRHPLLKSITVFAVCAGMAWADVQQDIDDYKSQKTALEAELKKLDVRIASTDSIAKDELKRFDQTLKRQQEDLARRKAELDTLQGRIAKVAAELQSEKNRQGSYLLTTENVKAYRAGIAKNLAEQCKDLELMVEQSLPWDRETRLERIRSLRRDLEAGNSTPDEGIARIRAIYAEEIRFGDEVVLLNRPFTRNDGEIINARLLRMGNQWMIYSDENETKYGVLQRSLGKDGKVAFSWKEDFTFEERNALKFALDVKLGRRPPQPVRLPLTLTLHKDSAEAKK